MRRSPLRVAVAVAWLAAGAAGAACTRERPQSVAAPPLALEPGPDAGMVQVDSTPPGLEVVAAGGARCRTPCSLRLDPGIHRLTIRAPSYMPWQEDVAVPPRGEVRVSASPVGSH